MMVGKIAYIEKRFADRNLQIVAVAHQIMEEYRAQGFVLTVRQLYYQFVARDLIENTMQSYKRLSGIINDARMGGYLDWDLIEDRTRNLEEGNHFDDPKDALEVIHRAYAIDMWENQEIVPEVWIEKEALAGIIERVCRTNDVPYFCCRGYVSQSEEWRAGRRILNRSRSGQRTVVIHLGDHDPSGIDMTRDNQERLSLFAEGYVEVQRIALNMDQVEEYDPPPNPAKFTDSRITGYLDRFGDQCWELDALEPSVIESLIQDAVDEVKDPDLWEAKEAELEAGKFQLETFIEECDL